MAFRQMFVCVIVCAASSIGCDAGDAKGEGDSATNGSDSSADSGTETEVPTDTEKPTDSDTPDTATETEKPTDTGAPIETDTPDTATETEIPSDSDNDTDTQETCDIVPGLMIHDMTRLDISGCENLTFDNTGHLIAITVTGDLISVKYPDEETVILPNVTGSREHISARAARFLPDGETLIYADRVGSALMKVDLKTLVQTPIVSGVTEPNGLAVHRNGTVYMTAVADTDTWDGSVWRVNPETGDNDIVFTADGGGLDGIALSPDASVLYFSSEEFYLYRLPLNDDGTPAGIGELLTVIDVSDEAWSGWMMADEIACDVCGNIYMTNMDGPVYRVAPDGSNQTTVLGFDIDAMIFGGDLPTFMTANAVAFGSGHGEWDAQSLYVISMEGGLLEVPVGVTGAVLPHLR